jgi:transaldolase
MPEPTLNAFADHGRITTLLRADGGDCEEVIERFAKAGIDVYALAARLQEDGAKSFSKSWAGLQGVIAAKAAALAKGSVGHQDPTPRPNTPRKP